MGNAVMSVPFTICITTFLPIVFFGALITFGTANIIGLYQNKLKFLNLFLPPGTPRMISFILVPVEIIAYVARLVSLSVRLFANMLAGYILMEMFFTFLLMSLSSPFVNIIPSFLLFIVLVLLAMLKLLISFLQAYIFSLLVSFYLNDPIHLH
jgi:F-type H+-transporting ATPase subunit a